MNTHQEILCPCGASLIPGGLATEEYVDAWKAEHEGHTAPERVPPPRLDVGELCRREGYGSSPYGVEGAVLLADEVDALVCARALRKKGHVVTVTGLILEVKS